MSAVRTWIAALGVLAALAGCRSERDPRALVERLAESRTREKAETALTALPPSETWWLLLQKLRHPESSPPELRRAAIRVIRNGASRDTPLPPAIGDVLVNDPDAGVRREALDALVAWGDPGCYDEVLSAAEREKDAALRAEIDGILGRFDEIRRAWYVRELAGADTPAARALAARALGDMHGGDPDARVLAEALAREPLSLVRQEIARALGEAGGDVARDAVLGALAHPDPYVRASAAHAAGRIGDPAAVAPLGQLLAGDPVEDIRIGAARALGTIGGAEARAALERGCVEARDAALASACRLALAREP